MNILKQIRKLNKINKIEILNEKKFLKQLSEFKSTIKEERFTLNQEDFWKCFDDNTAGTDFDRHYVYHTAWATRKLAETRPELHIDIASKLYFIALASAIVPIEFYDYRPAPIELPNLKVGKTNLSNLQFVNNSIKSLSCMHVVEHIGLGRYGDPIDYNGDLIAINELKRVLAPEGNLFFVVPIGKEAKIQYNAHRIYTYEQILSYFDDFNLCEFAFIKYSGTSPIYVNPTNEIINEENYGCGCFWFKKD